MSKATFENSVFINCPFDEEYRPILWAMMFCIIWFGLYPRLATEVQNSAGSRLTVILDLIKASKYSIHDISRAQASKAGEISRMNMPFELGLDFGCKAFGGNRFDAKIILVLDEKSHRYDMSLSDISGNDIESHEGKYEVVIRKVRNWLITSGSNPHHKLPDIIAGYEDFQEWYFETKEAEGLKEDEILDYSTLELLFNMRKWIDLGKPV